MSMELKEPFSLFGWSRVVLTGLKARTRLRFNYVTPNSFKHNLIATNKIDNQAPCLI